MKVNRADASFGKLSRAAREASGHLPGHLPPILVFTDPVRSAPPLDLAAHIPPGWGLVYRHFGARGHREVAAELSKLAGRREFHLLIGSDPDLARQVGAHGVHWPERLARQAAQHASLFQINTLAAHSPSSVIARQPVGIDARVLSTVFPSNSQSASTPMGALKFRAACQSASIPMYGLGGINGDTAGAISPCAGLAGIGVL